MARLASKTCETAKPWPGRERLPSDGDGLNLRIRPNGTKTRVVEYEFKGRRRKATIGAYDRVGSPGESITAWREHGRLTLAQARSIAGAWKAERRAARDPVAKWEGACHSCSPLCARGCTATVVALRGLLCPNLVCRVDC